MSKVSNTMGTARVNAVVASLTGSGVLVLGTVVREYMGAHELARTRGYPVTDPAVEELSQGPARLRAREAAKDLNGVFMDVFAMTGGFPA